MGVIKISKSTKSNKKDAKASLEIVECVKKVMDHKTSCEANIVAILWKDYDLFYQHDNLTIKDFSNNCWKVYFTIGYEILIKEHKKSLDDVTVGLYLEKHLELKAKYDEYGGFNMIQNASEYVKIENLDGYLKENDKFKVILRLLKNKFPVHDRLSDFMDMTIEEIYDEYDAILNNVFVNIEGDEQVHDMSDGIHELIDRMNEGLMVGLPLKKLDILTRLIGGCMLGNITMCLGNTGSGKSSFARNVLVPSVIDNDEKMMYFLNEENEDKFKSEILVYVANNIFAKNKKIKKYEVRNGNYSSENEYLLRQAADWMIKNKDKIKVIPFKTYKTAKVIKYIKKYSALGYNYFCIDTFKIDADDKSVRKDHELLERGMQDLYDTIKESNKNVHLWVSAQLVKSSDKQRFLSVSDSGKSKNMLDNVSNGLMLRNVLEDEFEGGKKELRVFKITEHGSKIPVKLEKGNKYQIIFVPKGRFKDGDYQVVINHNLSTNEYEEIGICYITPDF